MIADAGFEVEGTGTVTLPEHRREVAATETARADLVRVRRRGTGTDLPPNA
jgi:biotin synthase